jgi:hypothetical protein
MAVTQILTTDTLEQMRVKVNTLAQNDFGDPALLGPAGIAATNVVGAVIELSSAIFSAAGFGVEDVTSSFQQVLPGEKLRVLGTSNQINAVVSVPDTLTISLTPDITISGNFTTSSGNITAGGSLHTLGTIEISGNTIRSTDSSQIVINDSVQFSGTVRTDNIRAISGADLNFGAANLVTTGFFYSSNLNGFVFEGSTSDAFETALRAEDPTSDNAIVFPNRSGTVITDGDTATVTNTMLAGSITGGKILDDAITEAKIADDAVGQDQLKSLVTLQILNSSGGVLKFIYGAGA